MLSMSVNGKRINRHYGEYTKGTPNHWEEIGADKFTCAEPMTDDDLVALRKELYVFPVVRCELMGLSEDRKTVYAAMAYDNCD